MRRFLMLLHRARKIDKANDKILIETGFNLLTEAGDHILIEG